MSMKRQWLWVFLIVMLVAMTAVLSVGCSEKQEMLDSAPVSEQAEETEEESVVESVPLIEIEMPDYELTYSGAFKDVIVTKELEGENAIQFTAKLSETDAHIFTLRFDSDAGELVTMLKDAEGNKIPVAFEMAALPENLNEEDLRLFCEAQEAVNEIVESLVLK